MEPAVNGRKEHPHNHLNLVRVQLFLTPGCVGVFDTLVAVLPFEFLSGHPKRALFLLPFFPVKAEIQGDGRFTVPVHHDQQLEAQHRENHSKVIPATLEKIEFRKAFA